MTTTNTTTTKKNMWQRHITSDGTVVAKCKDCGGNAPVRSAEKGEDCISMECVKRRRGKPDPVVASGTGLDTLNDLMRSVFGRD